MYEALLREIESRNITRHKLARECDINPSDMYQAIKGDKKFHKGWKERICKYLDMEYSDLFDEEV